MLAAAVVVACSADITGGESQPPGPEITRAEPEGDERNFALGFSNMPSERTTDSYIRGFANTAQYGELALIHRAPPWDEFFPNRQVSQDTVETTQLETALLDQYDHLDLVYAIDPTDPVVERARAGGLPSSVSPGEGFRNPEVRNAFVAYTRYVVTNYEPEYLVLGVEVNMLRDRSPEQFEAFVSLYEEAYENAKAADPDIQVFPTFQLDDLQGNLGRVHPPQWEALEPFSDMMDVLAVSTYPYLANILDATEIGEDYFAQLPERFDGPVMVLDTAYPSAPVSGQSLLGSPEDQQRYVELLLNAAEEHGFAAVVWRAAFDPSYGREGNLAAFADVGLRESDGSNKPAWTVWEQWARRPYEEATPAPADDTDAPMR